MPAALSHPLTWLVTVAVDVAAGSLLVPMTRYAPPSCGPGAGAVAGEHAVPGAGRQRPVAPVLQLPGAAFRGSAG